MSKVIIFPTDTVYGIGTPIFDIEGIERIYNIKHRPKEKPLACLCANLEQIESIAYVTKDQGGAYECMKKAQQKGIQVTLL